MNVTKRILIVSLSAMLAVACALLVAGCGQQQSPPSSTDAQAAADSEKTTTLVAYFSATGNTEMVAADIADYTGADVFVIAPEQPYTREDLNYRFIDSRISKEHDDPTLRDIVLARTTPDDWDRYQTVFIGYPIWWGEAAWPVTTFVKANDFAGKTIIPFCTSASSDLGESAKNLAALADGGSWMDGMRFPSDVDSAEVLQWVESLGLEKQDS